MKSTKIRELMEKNGIRFSHVAKRLGLTRQNFSYHLTKEYFPEEFDKKLEEIFGENDKVNTELQNCKEKIVFLENLISQKDKLIDKLSN